MEFRKINRTKMADVNRSLPMCQVISRALYALNACNAFFNLKNSHFTCKETKEERGNVVCPKIT